MCGFGLHNFYTDSKGETSAEPHDYCLILDISWFHLCEMFHKLKLGNPSYEFANFGKHTAAFGKNAPECWTFKKPC